MVENIQEKIFLSVNNIDSPIILTDKEGYIEWCNNAFEEQTGYLLKEVIGLKPGSFLQGKDTNPQTITVIREKIKSQKPFSEDILNYHKSGKSYWTTMYINPTFDKSNNLINYLSIQVDITDKKFFDQKLLNSEINLKLAQKISKTGSWTFNILDNTLVWSEELYNIFEIENSNNLYQDYLSRIHKDDFDALMGKITKSQMFGEDYELEHKIVSPNTDKIKYLYCIGKVIKDEQENIVCLKGIVQDITERKEYELAILKAKEKAEQATKAKSNFLAMISHEIRTPLNGVIGMTSLLGDTELTEQQREILNDLQISSKLLLNIINDILDFSKIESGKISLDYQSFNIRDLINEVITVVKLKCEQKNNKLSYNFSEDIPEILYSDALKIRQILLNLISNAVKFTTNGNIDINVNLLKSETSFVQLQFSIKDTGIGIPDDEIKNLFQEFYQIDSSFTKKYEGTGLGLAISKKFIELLEGNIEVFSKEGFGTEFIFDLKLQKSDILEVIEESQESLSTKNLSILVAEDNAINRKLLIKMLDKLNLKADTAKDGLNAINQMHRKHYDLVLMDIHMPEMDGIETSKYIMTNFKNPPVIIAITADILRENQEECYKSGMSDYISKPISLKNLADTINKWI